MKPLVTLAFFISLILISSCSFAHPGGRTSLVCPAITKGQQPGSSIIANTIYISQATAAGQPDDFSACIEEEDDQDEINRQVSASRYFIAFYYAFFLSSRNSMATLCLAGSKPLLYSGSCKYIIQRTLRI